MRTLGQVIGLHGRADPEKDTARRDALQAVADVALAGGKLKMTSREARQDALLAGIYVELLKINQRAEKEGMAEETADVES
jgi:hypothetical protein